VTRIRLNRRNLSIDRVSSTSWLKRQLRTTLTRSGRDDGTAPIADEAPRRQPLHAPPRRLIVVGDDPLAHRLIEELITRYGVEVTAVLPSKRRNHGPDIVALLGQHRGRVIEVERLDADAFRLAGLDSADALALVRQDDVGNIHAALLAQELNPQVRLVMRMFNTRLGHGVRRLFTDCRVLSDAAMAGPAFVAAALGEVAPVHVRVASRTLIVANREDVRPAEIICGLARPAPQGQSDLLPDDPAEAELVLAVARGDRDTTYPRHRGWQRRAQRWLAARVRHPFGALDMLIGPKLRFAAVVLLVLLALGTFVLSRVKDISWLNAAYLTILTSLGNAGTDLTASYVEKITQTVLTVVSIALIPTITAAVVEAVVNARLAIALGRLREPVSDHVVLVGLGNVGTRVMHELVDLGISVVAIDKNDDAKGAQSTKSRGVPLIVGDASQIDTLRAASVQTCRAMIVVSTDDVINLEAAIQARVLNDDLRVVLRLFDGDFADRVQRAFGITSSRSVSYLAAPAFAAALLEREVIGTIPVDRFVLLLAEAAVAAASPLDGATVGHASEAGEVRVLALVTEEGRNTIWAPPAAYVLQENDLLVVVATKGGLGRLLRKANPTT
jgi:Trk K+ transport system NAD-binding subunit